MGNLLQYTDKSITINNKLNSLLAKINYDYQNGIIRTETEYYYRIKNMLSEFYKSLVNPMFQYRPAISTPMSDEYNAMINESYNDMEYIIKDCETLKDFVSQSFTDTEFGRSMLSNELTYLSKKITAIGESISLNQSNGSVVFTELFNDFKNFGNINSEKSCRVDTEYGILTLKPSTSNEGKITGVNIDNTVSNGFPGNTHCVDTLNGELHYSGREGLRNDPSCIIDSNIDTWFEFELFSLSDEVRKACNSYGFEYEERISWVNNDDILRLKLILTVSSKTNCTWISLTPYLSDIKGVNSCYLEKCVVISASNNAYEVAANMIFDDTLILPFPAQSIQRIEIIFVQPFKYLTKIGHTYYTEVNTSEMSIFQEYDYSDSFTRIDGDKPSVSLIGAKYIPSEQWIEYPNNNTDFSTQEYVKDKLFSIPESTLDKKVGQEIIDAYRYMIGIRQIAVMSCFFLEYGEYVSNPFTTSDVITSIMLDSEEYIPGDDSEIIRYFISLNGGITWHKIYPSHRAYDGIYKYYVNNDSIENLLSNNLHEKKTRNLSIAGSPTSIQLKIEMDRLKDNCYSTPIVYSYRLKLTTGGDTIEY